MPQGLARWEISSEHDIPTQDLRYCAHCHASFETTLEDMRIWEKDKRLDLCVACNKLNTEAKKYGCLSYRRDGD